MSDWTQLLRSRLDALEAPLTVFFRDDDAGPVDQRLYRLLDLFAVYEAPIDLAVVPAALENAVARLLLARRAENPALLGLHQHGYRHSNHAISGRKCEFGADRDGAAQAQDIVAGRLRLHDAFGPAAEPIFTPPWNRCSQATVAALNDSGFTTLSRNVGAETLALGKLAALDVSVDWCKGARPQPQALLAAIDACVAHSRPLGVMLHHEVMHEESFDTLELTLAALGRHPRVRCSAMRFCAATGPAATRLAPIAADTATDTRSIPTGGHR